MTALSRRDFLKRAGVGAAIATGYASGWGALPCWAETAPSEAAWGVLIDLTRCTGCEACVLACKQSNGLVNAQTTAIALDHNAYSCLESHPLAEGGVAYVKRQCMHCLQPACVSACTVGALQKTAAGPVVYDDSKCIGCRYCQYACPFGVPTFDWDDPLGLIHKCQFCQARLVGGESPACIAACPNGALRFGRREELLAQAHAQIQSNPGRYVDHVYGEHEAGGTSVLYLSAEPFNELGFPQVGSEAIPHQAEAVMRQTPLVAATVATVATALAWLTGRQHKLPPTAAPADEEEQL